MQQPVTQTYVAHGFSTSFTVLGRTGALPGLGTPGGRGEFVCICPTQEGLAGANLLVIKKLVPLTLARLGIAGHLRHQAGPSLPPCTSATYALAGTEDRMRRCNHALPVIVWMAP